MENPYEPPKTQQRRVFSTPIIVPISVVMVVVIYFSYVFFFFNSEESGLFSLLTSVSFEIFILCEIGIVSAVIYNKKQLDGFLAEYPEIDSKLSIEKLKPIARTNMYSALFNLFFLGLGSLTAIMSILNHGLVKGVVVAILSIAAARMMKWYNSSEESIKQIKCTDQSLEIELKKILECWLHKPLPNF